MKIISLLALFHLTSCISTKLLYVEVRVDKRNPQIGNISIIKNTSSSSTSSPTITKSDNDYNYYEFSSLFESNRKCNAIVEFSANRDGIAISEVYDLKKHGLSLRRNWSQWLTSDSTFTPSDGLGLGSWYSLMHNGSPEQGSYPFPPRTSMRYRIEKWNNN